MNGRGSGRWPAAACLALGMAAACSPGGEENTGTEPVSVRDSAGIEIVSNRIPAWSAGEDWTIDPEPVAEIGATDATGPEQFQLVYVPTLLPGDRVAAVDGGTHEIRVFEADGRHVATLGREGEGPGEFRSLPRIGSAGPDGVFAYDRGNATLTTFAFDGSIRSEVPLQGAMPVAQFPTGIPYARVVGFFSDGSFVGARSRDPVREGTGAWTDTVFVEPAVVLSGGDSVIPLGRYPERELARTSSSGASHPWFPATLLATSQDPPTIFRTSEAGRALIAMAPDGRTLRVSRIPLPRTPLTPELIEDELDLQAGLAEMVGGGSRTEIERAFDLFTLPDSAPAASAIHADLNGNVWISRWARARRASGTEWDVVNSDGRWLGTVSVPEEIGFLQAIGSDHILTLRMDEFDVEVLGVYRIRRGGG